VGAFREGEMEPDQVFVRLARPKDRHIWEPEPPSNPYLDEIWENGYSDLKRAMQTPTREFQRLAGGWMAKRRVEEERIVRLIAEREGVVVGYLEFRREPEFHRAVQARITQWRYLGDRSETPEQKNTTDRLIVQESCCQATSRGIRWLTYRCSARGHRTFLEPLGFVEYGRLPWAIESFQAADAEGGETNQMWNEREYVDEVFYYLPTGV
jgi:hypothetical protein